MKEEAMAYIDGFVIPVPRDKKDAYRAMAAKAAPLFREHGALRVVECWGDDVPHGKTTDFYRAVAATEEETMVFSWIVWPSREARDEGNRKVMADTRMEMPADMPADFKRLIFGGFEVMLDTGSDEENSG
jgi:uncharacterized protein YbaA (DUF1428 family)